MKIALAQINPFVGDLKGNSKKILSAIRKIRSDLIVFPELSLTGYCPQDLILKKKFVKDNIDTLQYIAKKSNNKNIIIGFIDSQSDELYNAAALISNKKIIYKYYKRVLPNYSIFDEKRYFKTLNRVNIFSLNHKKFSINICEDIWFSEVCMEQKQSGAEFIMNISASPYSYNKIANLEKILLQRYNEINIPILYVNQVGCQDGIVYYGHSMFINNGKIIKKAKDFEEDTLIVDI